MKLASGHDHSLIPAYTSLEPLSHSQKEKLRRPGPKFGSVVKIWAEKCAFEVTIHPFMLELSTNHTVLLEEEMEASFSLSLLFSSSSRVLSSCSLSSLVRPVVLQS